MPDFVINWLILIFCCLPMKHDKNCRTQMAIPAIYEHNPNYGGRRKPNFCSKKSGVRKETFSLGGLTPHPVKISKRSE